MLQLCCCLILLWLNPVCFFISQWHILTLKPKLTLLGCVGVWFRMKLHDGHREFVNKLFRGYSFHNDLWERPHSEPKVLRWQWVTPFSFSACPPWCTSSPGLPVSTNRHPWVERPARQALQSQILSSPGYTSDKWLCVSSSTNTSITSESHSFIFRKSEIRAIN